MDADFLNEFQGRFNDLRYSRNMTQTLIAQKAGMSRQNLGEILRVGNPTFKTLRKLASAMSINPSDFFCL